MRQVKSHWENIYATKQANEVSWTQAVPQTSLDFIHAAKLNRSAQIIDIGGGDSKLVDYLLDEGFMNISVLDISENALAKTQNRLGDKAEKVNWIVSDITDFQPKTKYDFWHDRAAFHFMTTSFQVIKYLSVARKSIKQNGFITIGTFSEQGPEKCSGLNVQRYSETTLSNELRKGFEKIKCITEEHTTPFNTKQNFLFCSFKRN